MKSCSRYTVSLCRTGHVVVDTCAPHLTLYHQSSSSTIACLLRTGSASSSSSEPAPAFAFYRCGRGSVSSSPRANDKEVERTSKSSSSWASPRCESVMPSCLTCEHRRLSAQGFVHEQIFRAHLRASADDFRWRRRLGDCSNVEAMLAIRPSRHSRRLTRLHAFRAQIDQLRRGILAVQPVLRIHSRLLHVSRRDEDVVLEVIGLCGENRSAHCPEIGTR